jgi:transcriptional regulator with XRE-family HTH domain
MARLNDKTKLKVMKLVRAGKSFREISEKVGVNQKTLWNRYGIAIVRAISPDVDYSRGLSLEEFARIFGDRKVKSARMIYSEQKARENGYESHAEYTREREEERERKNKELSSLLKEGLKKSGGNQNWFAKCLGITRQAASRILRGIDRPRYERLPRIAYVLDIDFETLKRVGRYR